MQVVGGIPGVDGSEHLWVNRFANGYEIALDRLRTPKPNSTIPWKGAQIGRCNNFHTWEQLTQNLSLRRIGNTRARKLGAKAAINSAGELLEASQRANASDSASNV